MFVRCFKQGNSVLVLLYHRFGITKLRIFITTHEPPSKPYLKVALSIVTLIVALKETF